MESVFKTLEPESFKAALGECPEDIEFMPAAIKVGRLDIVRYLHERGYPHKSGAMGLAAHDGQLEIVKFFHENDYPRTDAAMFSSAVNGHTEVFRFLAARNYPCDANLTMRWSNKKDYKEIFVILGLMIIRDELDALIK